MSVPKLVVHSDIILEYLLHRDKRTPVLRLVMMKFFCYTTVFDAIELFSVAKTAEERRSIEDVMSAMKILGLNAKNAKRYGDLVPAYRSLSTMQILVAGICLESKLSLLTSKWNIFRNVKGLNVIPSSAVSPEATAAEILSRRVKSRR